MKIKGDNIYFLGIGGIGMSALARFFAAQGKQVEGYDKTPSPVTDGLMAEGIRVSFDDDPATVERLPDMVVYTPAVPRDNKIFKYLLHKDVPFLKRSHALGIVTKDNFTIAVAGTHGKTTITSLITHILKEEGFPVTGFVGGICNNYNSNLILSENTEIIVVEADEFDRSFLTLYPDIAVISSMDADHLDIYKDKKYLEESFFLFSRQIKENGTLIIKEGLKTAADLKCKVRKFSYEQGGFAEASSLRVKDGKSSFILKAGDKEPVEIESIMPGKHNAENISAAISACLAAGVKPEAAARALRSYKGVKRRFDIRVQNSRHIYIDDYAHHPEEISATLSAVKSLFPEEKITVIFQPHLYSRTRDFADDFAKSLSAADEVMLMDIYPAREKPIEGINSRMLLDKISCRKKELVDFDTVVEKIKAKKPRLLLTLGAGDIDRIVKEIEEVLS